MRYYLSLTAAIRSEDDAACFDHFGDCDSEGLRRASMDAIAALRKQLPFRIAPHKAFKENPIAMLLSQFTDSTRIG